jgi:hypothetical protein
MAQTKTKQKSRSSSSKSKPRKAKSKTTNSSKSKAASAKQKVASNGASGSNGAGGIAGKALMAGGAALIGAAGGLAYGATHSGSKVMGVRMPGSKRVKFKSRDVRKAAKDVGHLGDQVGQFTKELRKARDDSDGSIGAPVEMLVRTFARRH